MILVLTGSSASGKSTLARRLPAVPGLVVHDFDEVGVPSTADHVWRQQTLEHWVQRAVELRASGYDLLLTGQSPLGEVLAAPSAPMTGGVAVCLVDCADADRVERLRQRDGHRWGPAGEATFLEWARWMRQHHADPTARPEVIRDGAWSAMRWERWSDWERGHPTWCAHVIDTSDLAVQPATDALLNWVQRVRQDGSQSNSNWSSGPMNLRAPLSG